MRGTRAKKLRNIIYGDQSHRVQEYKDINGPTRRQIPMRRNNGSIMLNCDGTQKYREVVIPGTLVNTGNRRQYQILKSLRRR